MTIPKLILRPSNSASLETVHNYFRNRYGGGAPEHYRLHPERGRWMANLILPYCPDQDAAILDIGCNVGRNSEALRQLGYNNLYGVDINPYAKEAMKQVFPELAECFRCLTGALEKVVPCFADNQFDVAFTMTVLMHLHPDSEWVFAEIARITRLLVTAENETANTKSRWARNYGEIFTGFGAVQVAGAKTDLAGGKGGYKLRVFDCEAVK